MVVLSLKGELKALIIKSGWTMTQVVDSLNKKHDRDTTVQNFSSKLIRGTLKYSEVCEILDLIGYKIEWVPKGEKV
ncbi:LLM class flavin-dependent oxidoreductase [Ruminiclostridium papyrosolvens DSM 2782]|uniref:LLM class flavin-dependent oxidoreductase n=1 Tax=Ruminiclostridium papyrosolvens TaxID=29362 RepID=UPI0018F2649C|nr:LLM class flavin-dependent oxidoreductase [Ruminiclostridium papyrosolvens]WES36602.1 LLM class flavin-dependent oxidoreductase [Ruminiclostridium papyrosolvens DSM 2782]WES36604.1 LLM class flavin-dependent oxidoreductase [Ruminiclostridium papyrosolvens DSM 2782]